MGNTEPYVKRFPRTSIVKIATHIEWHRWQQEYFDLEYLKEVHYDPLSNTIYIKLSHPVIGAMVINNIYHLRPLYEHLLQIQKQYVCERKQEFVPPPKWHGVRQLIGDSNLYDGLDDE